MLNHAIRFGALGLVALVGTAPAALVPTAALTSPRPAEAAPAKAPRQVQVECVVGFSKDYCGSLTPITHPAISACITPIPEGSCRTVRFAGALDVSMSNNNQICGSAVTATCNECDTGRLQSSSKFLIRLQPNCPYRGCWDADDASFTFTSGGTYKGPLTGTLGVGSHRPVTGPTTCSVSGGRDCERCYDVSFDASTGLWRLGFEASFHGVRSDADTGEEVCITLSGDFYIRGTSTTGPDWGSIWTVAGTADGIQLTFCP
jgi:hypothetical protein